MHLPSTFPDCQTRVFHSPEAPRYELAEIRSPDLGRRTYRSGASQPGLASGHYLRSLNQPPWWRSLTRNVDQSRDMLSRKLALPLMLVATVSQAFATSIANISLGTPTNYNATYPVYWMQGDTFFTSWCSDNPTGNINGGVTSDIYTWINDANHLVFNSAEQLTNHLLDGTTANMVLGYLSNATVGAAPRGMALGPVFAKRQVIRQFGGEGETDATTTPYGGSRNRATQSGADYGNWKTAGLLCVNDGTGGVGTGGGTDYIFAIAMRTIYEANASNLSAYTSGNIFPWGQPAFNAQMITQSEAAGAGPGLPGSTTWSGFTPAPPSGAYHFKKPEWPSSPASTGAGSSGWFDAGVRPVWARVLLPVERVHRL